MKRIEIVLCMLVAGLLVWGCSDSASQDESDAAPTQVVSVRTAPITRRDLPVTVEVNGTTEVRDRSTIVSTTDGTIVRLSAEVGTKVKSGDTLVVIRTRDSEASLVGAKRLIESAETPQQKSEAEKALEIARENEIRIPVVATRNGIIVDKLVSEGQTVTANTDLLEEADLSTLDFVANVQLRHLLDIKTGQPCTVDLISLPNRTFSGSVVSISAQSDPGSQTVPVRIQFALNTADLDPAPRIGMMGVAHIRVGEHRSALAVPNSALLRDDINDTYWIYTVSADSIAHEVPVSVGIITDSVAEIAGPGLTEGQAAIIQGNYEVSDSLRVTVEDLGSR